MLLSPDDRGLVTVFNSVAGVTVSVHGRVLTPDGKVAVIQGDIVPAATRAAVTASIELTEGWLLSLRVTTASTIRRGQCFVRVELQRGIGGAVYTDATLINDYVHLGYQPTWPNSRSFHNLEGPGILRSINVATPAAGVEWSQTVPTGARWVVRAGNSVFTASGAVANRSPAIVFDDGATILYTASVDTFRTAGQGATPQLGPVFKGASVDNAGFVVPMGSLMALFAGWRIRSITGSIQAADTWTLIQLLVEEWIEP
jgi:hypothetical protein